MQELIQRSWRSAINRLVPHVLLSLFGVVFVTFVSFCRFRNLFYLCDCNYISHFPFLPLDSSIHATSFCLHMVSNITSWGLETCIMDGPLPNRSLVKKMPHRLAHIPIIWRHSFKCGSLSHLCPHTKNQPKHLAPVNLSEKHVTIHLLIITFPFLSISISHSNSQCKSFWTF